MIIYWDGNFHATQRHMGKRGRWLGYIIISEPKKGTCNLSDFTSLDFVLYSSWFHHNHQPHKLCVVHSMDESPTT
jgi:hypothetical protein